MNYHTRDLVMILIFLNMFFTFADYTSREVVRSMSQVAYDNLLPPYYDKYAAPATDQEPAIVYFDMNLLDITSVNENDMTFSLETFVTYRWKDWRLRWPLDKVGSAHCWKNTSENITDPLEFSKVCSANYTSMIPRCANLTTTEKSKRFILDLKILRDIWQPDAFFKNGIRSHIHNDWVSNEYLAVYTSDGHIRLFSRMSITLSCHFELHYYPHDEQKCEMLIQSMSYRTDLVRFEWCESWAQQGKKLDEDIFSLLHFTLAKYEHVVCNEEYPCVKAVFIMRRHPDFHILHTYIPTVLIVILSWMSFWISPDATPARVTLGVTSILTMATQYSQSTKNLPPVSYIKSLDIWMITCMVYVFAALLEFAVVYHVHTKSFERIQEILHTCPEIAQNGSGMAVSSTMQRSSMIKWVSAWKSFSTAAIAIDQISRIIFPLTYVSFIVGYFVLLTGHPDKDTLSHYIPT